MLLDLGEAGEPLARGGNVEDILALQDGTFCIWYHKLIAQRRTKPIVSN